MRSNSQLLLDLCDIEQTQKTGLNKAFCIDEQTAIKKNLESGILRKLITNTEVKKYYIEWGGIYLIYTTDKTDIDNYPNIKDHLMTFKDKLDKRSENKDQKYPWWRIQRPRRESICTSPEKIIVPYYATENRFGYDNREDGNGYFGNTDTYVIVPLKSCNISVMYILALLNSRVQLDIDAIAQQTS